jgi:hypothetical protein
VVRRRFLGAAAAALLLAACGSDATPAPASSSDTALREKLQSAVASQAAGAASSAASRPTSSGSAHPGAATPSTTPAASQPSATPTVPQYAEGTTPAPAAATLSAACVTPGQSETLHLSAPPSYQVAFDTQYSDGQDGSAYGGIGQGTVSGDGQYISSWVVAPNAALGRAIVWIAVSGNDSSAFRQPEFTVASHC